MTEENTSLVIESGADPQGVSYTPEPKEPKAEAKPISMREALNKAADDIEAKGGKLSNERDDKEPEVKEDKPRGEGGKFAPKEAPGAKVEAKAEETQETSSESEEAKGTEQEADTKERSSEDRDIDKPPARFLPRAKEKWASADPDIRSEVRRLETELTKGLEEHRQSHEFRKELREYEDMAKQHGTTVKQALDQYTAIDKLLKEQPLAGIERVLSTIGVTPQQYANHILQNPPQQRDPNVTRLEQQLQQVTQQLQQVTQSSQQTQQQASIQQVESNIIAPFRASLGANDRYEELKDDIAFFLNSDRVPSNLSAQQRLATAYDMAERINPVGLQQNEENARLKPANADRPLNPAGAKSIKGAPTGSSGSKGAVPSSREAVAAAMAQLGL